MDDNRTLKDEFSREGGKGFQSRKRNMYTNKIFKKEYVWHTETDHYFAAFLTSSFLSQSHKTPNLCGLGMRGWAQPSSSQLYYRAVSDASAWRARRWRECAIHRFYPWGPKKGDLFGSGSPAALSCRRNPENKVSRQSQVRLLLRPRPPPSALALWGRGSVGSLSMFLE